MFSEDEGALIFRWHNAPKIGELTAVIILKINFLIVIILFERKKRENYSDQKTLIVVQLEKSIFHSEVGSKPNK